MKKIQRKGQITISDAPSIIILVGLLFLTMATVALIGNKYGNALDTDYTAGSVINESGFVNATGYTLALSPGKENFLVTGILIQNGTSAQVIPAANYSIVGNTVVFNSTALQYHIAKISYNYTYSASTVASNVTGNLETEIANNTSIAGIVLTISLVGIVLTILISVFLGVTRRSARV